MNACPLDRCDGSGMLDVYKLKTIVRHANGSLFVKRQTITRAQYLDLQYKVDGKDQTVETAANWCECRVGKTA